MNDQSIPSSFYATALLGVLISDGVQDVVVCPGSRSQALALAAAEAEQAGAIRLHVRTDERSAAFFALGVARETGLPAPVIVTSGTAVANLVPAAFEAHEGRVPLIMLTADRPAELRGTRSNQTTRQAGMIEGIARLSLDVDVEMAGDTDPHASSVHAPQAVASLALSRSLGSTPGPSAGPVQVNLQFREPLSGGGDQLVSFLEESGAESSRDYFARCAQARGQSAAAGFLLREDSGAPGGADVTVTAEPRSYVTRFYEPTAYLHEDDRLTVVIAGEGAGPEAEAFAHEAGLPLLAEVVSGSRFGREAICAYATLIDDPQVGGLTERAIVFGHPTLTRQVPALLKRDDVEVIVVDPHLGEGVDHYDPSGSARIVRSVSIAESYDARSMRRWLGAWVVADRALRERRTTVHAPDTKAARETGYRERSAFARAEVATLRKPITRDMLAESVWRATWPHDRLVVASSRLVRSLDAIAAPRRVEVRANRGLAGIDGTIATALGVAMASQLGVAVTESGQEVSAGGRDDAATAKQRLSAGVTRVLLGDQAMLHDAGSLLLPAREYRPRIQLFVGVDGGGSIFDTLEAKASAPAEAFERVMFAPQSANLASLAKAYGWEHRRVSSRGELERLLTEAVAGPELVEIPLVR